MKAANLDQRRFWPAVLVVKYKIFTNFSGISSPQANVKYVKLIKGILEIYL